MTGRPLIGITKPVAGDDLAFFAVCLAVWLAGGRPRPITAERPGDDIAFWGLVLGGGSDVYPQRFAGIPKEAYDYDHPREAVEEAWAARAEATGLPTLGICRGAQLMNVLDGGSLHMDVAAAYADVVYPNSLLQHALYRKPIVVEPGSLLHRLTGHLTLQVNSIHRQSIAGLGEGLKITGVEPNGVVQAIEGEGRGFWLGVQFHPELLIHRGRFRRIFEGLVAAAKKRREANA